MTAFVDSLHERFAQLDEEAERNYHTRAGVAEANVAFAAVRKGEFVALMIAEDAHGLVFYLSKEAARSIGLRLCEAANAS